MLAVEGDVKGGIWRNWRGRVVNRVDIFQRDLNNGGCMVDKNEGGEKRVLEVR